MGNFIDWFDNKLVIGGFPKNVNETFDPTEFDYIINMSDEFYFPIDVDLQQNGCKTFWFPMNEVRKDIGLNSIYGAMIVLYEAEKANKRVYLHCHAGVNRSRATQAAYYLMRTGNQYEFDNSTGYINRLVAMSMRGYLPPKAEMEKFFSTLGQYLDRGWHKDKFYSAGMLDRIKLDTITNF